MSAAPVRPPISNSYWVVPGRMAAGEYPGHVAWDIASQKVKALLQAGIDCFVDLTEAGVNTPYADVLRHEATLANVNAIHVRHPIVDGSVPRSPGQMVAVLDAIDDALGQGKTVYVHCLGGLGRTGTVIGCWLVRHGRTGDAALAQIAQWRNGAEAVLRQAHSPETREQCDYVRTWKEPGL